MQQEQSIQEEIRYWRKGDSVLRSPCLRGSTLNMWKKSVPVRNPRDATTSKSSVIPPLNSGRATPFWLCDLLNDCGGGAVKYTCLLLSRFGCSSARKSNHMTSILQTIWLGHLVVTGHCNSFWMTKHTWLSKWYPLFSCDGRVFNARPILILVRQNTSATILIRQIPWNILALHGGKEAIAASQSRKVSEEIENRSKQKMRRNIFLRSLSLE